MLHLIGLHTKSNVLRNVEIPVMKKIVDLICLTNVPRLGWGPLPVPINSEHLLVSWRDYGPKRHQISKN